jgi:ABC-type nitrate/sulfonate/bicarbonate transport system permease component
VIDAGAAATHESRAGAIARRVGVAVLVVAALWGLWEGYKWLWEETGWGWPFAVDDTSMPHLHDVFAAFWQPTTTGGPPLINSLLHATWFTAKEALAGFLLGGVIGFSLAVALAP